MSFTGTVSDILHSRTNYDFVGRRRRWFLVSAVLILIGGGALLLGGLNLGIDFEGGTAWQVQVEDGDPSVADVRELVEREGLSAKVVVLGGDTVRVQGEQVDRDTQQEVQQLLADYAGTEPEAVSITDVGPTWGEQVSDKAIRALVFFFVVIAAYLSLRFEPKMAVAALAAVVHDILITVGAYAVTRFEVSPATVIAFLTILGFSIYDTVVVFDKVKENTDNMASGGKETYSDVVNRTMNLMLMRSLNTSIVAVLPVLSLLGVGSFLFGAVTIRDFALALTIGLLAGTYSSIFIAVPLLAILKERESRYVALRQRLEGRAGGGVPSGADKAPADAGGGDEEPAPVGAPGTSRRSGPGPRPRQQRRKRR